MSFSISKIEKLDIFLALATFYGFNFPMDSNENRISNQIQTAFQSLTALNNADLKVLNERAFLYESLSPEKQKNWQKFWLEKLRNRGQTIRLDENIHPEHILEYLKNEPAIIQRLIFENLPEKLAIAIEKSLEIEKRISDSYGGPINLPNEKTGKTVRDKFLSNFVAFEDIFQPNTIDELTADDLDLIIWKLGIRETVISCRGINTKENLAVFLKPFGDQVKKEIVLKFSEFEDVKSKRVVIAEKTVSKIFQENIEPNEKLKNVGLYLIAIVFAFCDQNSKKFTIQKLPIKVGEILSGYIAKIELENQDDIKEIKSEILELAIEFEEKAL